MDWSSKTTKNNFSISRKHSKQSHLHNFKDNEEPPGMDRKGGRIRVQVSGSRLFVDRSRVWFPLIFPLPPKSGGGVPFDSGQGQTETRDHPWRRDRQIQPTSQPITCLDRVDVFWCRFIDLYLINMYAWFSCPTVSLKPGFDHVPLFRWGSALLGLSVILPKWRPSEKILVRLQGFYSNLTAQWVMPACVGERESKMTHFPLQEAKGCSRNENRWHLLAKTRLFVCGHLFDFITSISRLTQV